ncbi:MAG: VOC family protein [Anaerolineaceae bacterium]
MASIRYLVDDVDAAVTFYTERLGFVVVTHMGAPFASVQKGDLTLWLAGPRSSAARPMPDGRQPEPGGWNRLVIEVADIAAVVADLRAHGGTFRNDIVTGPGGQQIVCEDPSGNPIEIFQPA